LLRVPGPEVVARSRPYFRYELVIHASVETQTLENPVLGKVRKRKKRKKGVKILTKTWKKFEGPSDGQWIGLNLVGLATIFFCNSM
jgi:hypothetical protein